MTTSKRKLLTCHYYRVTWLASDGRTVVMTYAGCVNKTQMKQALGRSGRQVVSVQAISAAQADRILQDQIRAGVLTG